MDNSDNTQLRLGFAGTPQFAATILEYLVAAGMTPTVVYTRPDKRQGRGRKTAASPVKALAQAHDITIEQPPTLKRAAYQQTLAEYKLDLLVVAAYGLILPPAVLEAPTLGCLNVHASLLPKWRGAAPIERSIMAGDTLSGICLMGMEAGLDTGPVFAKREIAITEQTTGQQLEADLAKLGGEALVEFLRQGPTELRQALSNGTPQDDGLATYAHKLTPADAVMDWTRPAVELAYQVNALSGRMPAIAHLGELKVQLLAATVTDTGGEHPPGQIVAADKSGIKVATGQGALTLTLVKLNRGKGKPLAPADLLNGYAQSFKVGAHFDLSALQAGAVGE